MGRGTFIAWEARVLPLYDVREDCNSTLDFTVQQTQCCDSGVITVMTVALIVEFASSVVRLSV